MLNDCVDLVSDHLDHIHTMMQLFLKDEKRVSNLNNVLTMLNERIDEVSDCSNHIKVILKRS